MPSSGERNNFFSTATTGGYLRAAGAALHGSPGIAARSGVGQGEVADVSMVEQESVLVRIAALERQNRRLRWMTLGLGVLVIAGVCLSLLNIGAHANAPAPMPKAEKLVLHDETGKERIVLKADKDDPRIQIFNSDGKLVTLIGNKRGVSYLIYADSKGIPRLELIGGDVGTRLGMMDENSVPRMDISASGNPLLLFRDEKGRRILEVLKNGPKLTFFDKEGKPLFSKP